MIDGKAAKRITELEAEYQRKWGREPDYFAMPSYMTQEQLAAVLERIVETDESIITAWSALFCNP